MSKNSLLEGAVLLRN